MLPKLFSTLLHTLFWAIPAWILHPWAGATVLVLGAVAYFLDSTRFTWLPDQGSFWDRVHQIWHLLGTLAYWAIGTAALSAIAYLIRLGWDFWVWG
jgi:predicted membrane channel-forming protein YqfA (hemolysin III family)